MSEYIKKADVVKLCENYSEYCFDNCDFLGASNFERLQNDIEQLPTADVVEVVRCKDCTRRVDYEGMIMCNKFGHKFQGEWYGLRATTEDHYCSYGERKDVSILEITTEGGTSDA